MVANSARVRYGPHPRHPTTSPPPHNPPTTPPHHITTPTPHAPPHHATRYMRDALTIIALLWLAFCTLFIFMWAVRAQDNDLLLTIAMSLSVNFCFGEIITNPATVSYVYM